MSYNEDEDEVGGFKMVDGDEEELGPLEDGAINDFRFDEDTDDDPDKDH